jgi:hypothetical protein
MIILQMTSGIKKEPFCRMEWGEAKWKKKLEILIPETEAE